MVWVLIFIVGNRNHPSITDMHESLYINPLMCKPTTTTTATTTVLSK